MLSAAAARDRDHWRLGLPTVPYIFAGTSRILASLSRVPAYALCLPGTPNVPFSAVDKLYWNGAANVGLCGFMTKSPTWWLSADQDQLRTYAWDYFTFCSVEITSAWNAPSFGWRKLCMFYLTGSNQSINQSIYFQIASIKAQENTQ